MRLLPSPAEALLLVAFLGHVLLVPGTKVEESFTLHAARDALVYGYKGEGVVDKWDHVDFAGAVPRSFIPPLTLAGLSAPVLEVATRLELLRNGLNAQVAVRLTLSFFSALSLIFLSRRVASAYGAKVAKYFLLLVATSFHVPFWAGRTIPNMLIFPLIQVALAFLVTPPALVKKAGKPRGATKATICKAFELLAFSAAVGRLEIAALAVPFALEHLLRGSMSFVELVELAVVTGGASIGLSIAVDTPLWKSATWLWPEGQAAFFNVVQGKSAEWGVEPFYFYLFPVLPRLLHLTLPFSFFSLAIDRRTRRLLWPCIGFIVLMSALPHKEWRFIVYVIPAFFVAASAGVVAVGAITASSRLRRLFLLTLLSLNALTTLLGLSASLTNYPGLSAVRALESHLSSSGSGAETRPVTVWVGVEAKMKGASNFVLFDSAHAAPGGKGERAWYLPPCSAAITAPNISYDKSESPSLVSPFSPSSLYSALNDRGFDYAILDASTPIPRADQGQVVVQTREFGGVDWKALARGRARSVEGLVEGRLRDSVSVVKLRQS
ncbi:hypothetical protein JCM8547_000049 [Rhodosporidiobolus lusitaniae]